MADRIGRWFQLKIHGYGIGISSDVWASQILHPNLISFVPKVWNGERDFARMPLVLSLALKLPMLQLIREPLEIRPSGPEVGLPNAMDSHWSDDGSLGN